MQEILELLEGSVQMFPNMKYNWYNARPIFILFFLFFSILFIDWLIFGRDFGNGWSDCEFSIGLRRSMLLHLILEEMIPAIRYWLLSMKRLMCLGTDSLFSIHVYLYWQRFCIVLPWQPSGRFRIIVTLSPEPNFADTASSHDLLRTNQNGMAQARQHSSAPIE